MANLENPGIEYTQAQPEALLEYEIEMEAPILAEALDYASDLKAGCTLDIEDWRRIGYPRTESTS